MSGVLVILGAVWVVGAIVMTVVVSCKAWNSRPLSHPSRWADTRSGVLLLSALCVIAWPIAVAQLWRMS